MTRNIIPKVHASAAIAACIALSPAGCGSDVSSGCPEGQVACGEFCIDPLTDPAHCGAGLDCVVEPGTDCAGGEACVAGSCVLSCPGDQVACEGSCVDPLTDPVHCGAGADCATEPGTDCAGGEACVAGECSTSCPGTQIVCAAACVDPLTDATHCGAGADCATEPGTDCADGEACVAGECVITCPGDQIACDGVCIDPLADPAHCGAGPDCATTPGIACGPSELCVAGACDLTCPPWLEECDTTCVDLRWDHEHCGACGEPCRPFEACVDEVCRYVGTLPASCAGYEEQDPGLPDGLYTVDPDRDGPGGEMLVYCDLTTAGGGWTLTYKVRNDIDDDSFRWWNQVMPGSGTAFPQDLASPPDPTQGAEAATRDAYTTATRATEWRATMIDPAGVSLLDVASSYMSTGGQALRCFATGMCTTADQTCTPTAEGYVIENNLGYGPTPGTAVFLCDVGWTDCDSCVDWSNIQDDDCAGCGDEDKAYVGDSSIGRTTTFTAYWVR